MILQHHFLCTTLEDNQDCMCFSSKDSVYILIALYIGIFLSYVFQCSLFCFVVHFCLSHAQFLCFFVFSLFFVPPCVFLCSAPPTYKPVPWCHHPQSIQTSSLHFTFGLALCASYHVWFYICVSKLSLVNSYLVLFSHRTTENQQVNKGELF